MSNKKSSKQTKKDDEEFRPNNESIDESMSGVERANKTKRKHQPLSMKISIC
jgi:hypothetical protein